MSDLGFITDPSKWKDITPDMYDEINAQIDQTFEEGCHGDCSSCQSDCDSRENGGQKLPVFAKRMYAVTGGKGGTGKSSVCVMLAAELNRRGLKVGILDCDIYNSSIPQLMGLKGPIQRGEEDKMVPVTSPEGILVNSINLIVDDRNEAIIWPGVDAFNIVAYLYTDTLWGELDVLLLDMPSGAGDIPLNLYTTFPVDGTVIVTGPGELAVAPTQRCINLCAMLMSPPIAYVESKGFTEEPVSDGLYVLPKGCVTVSMPLCADVTALGDDGQLQKIDSLPLLPVVERIEKAAQMTKKRK